MSKEAVAAAEAAAADAQKKVEEAKAKLAASSGKNNNDEDEDGFFEDDKERAYTKKQSNYYIDGLRGESGKYRKIASDRKIRNEQLEAELGETKARLAKIDADNKVAEEKRLSEQGEFKTLAEKREQERNEVSARLQSKLVSKEIAYEMERRGIPKSLLAVVEKYKSGVSIDEDGEITGMEKVFDRFASEHPDLVELGKGKGKKKTKQAEETEDEEDGDEDDEENEDEDEDEKEKKAAAKKKADLANAGREPSPGSKPSRKPKVDAKKMTAAEYKEYMSKKKAGWKKQG